MSNSTRDLMHRTLDGNPSLIPIMHQLSHYRDVDKFLKWLIQNSITGKTLSEWLKKEHDNSIMNMVKFIIKRHNKADKNASIILGRDWFK